MSTYFAATESINITPANQSLPIQFFHGIYDTVVSEDQAKSSLKKLADLGLKPEYKSFLIDHSVCLEEISAISKWIQEKIGGQF
jgi:phospholipase/carboxylesterase